MKLTQWRIQNFKAVRGRARRVLVQAADGKMKVVVTGGAGRTGKLVVEKLLARKDQFQPRAVVRGDKSRAALTALGLEDKDVYGADITKGDPVALAPAFSGADALVIATSAVPVLKPLSLFPVLLAKITGKQGVRPEFDWKGGQRPEQVDWIGQKTQIDAAKAAGIKHVVLIGSMGGTQPDNMLNKLGNGNILLWKRKAEQYLIASGLTYTIIHPGGLVDAKGGERELVLGVDDKLLERTFRQIPRADVAELAVQSLLLPDARNRAVDAVSVKPGEGSGPTTDFAALFGGLQGNCDYSIHSQLDTVAVSAQ